MKTFFRKWRGLPVAIAIAVSTLPAHAAVQVKTLGGGPNETSPSRSGSANGDTFRHAKFNNPYSIAIDTNGNLYVADKSNNKVRKITKPGAADSLTSTFASRLPGAVGVAVDGSNLIYVVTQNDGRLRVFTSGGTLVRTVSGLVKPSALALDGNGNVYVAELVGNVKVIAPDDSVFLVTSGFGKLRGIAILPNGLLAVSESDNHAIHTVDPNDGSTALLAGGNGRGFAEGDALSARFDQPHGLALAPDGSLMIADRFNHRVRVINSNSVVRTLYGIDRRQWSPGFPGWADGPGGDSGTAAAREPLGLTVAKNGTVYVGEGFWDLIRQATGGSTNGTGTSTNGTNVFVVGTNIMSFGFAAGEVSADFLAAPGQTYFAPITLQIPPEQQIMSMQFAVTATNGTGPAVVPADFRFYSRLLAKKQVVNTNTVPAVTNISFTSIVPNYAFINNADNLMGIGWLERDQGTNLYNTLEQDLITYSISHNTAFEKEGQRLVLGGFGFKVPVGSAPGDTFPISLIRASADVSGFGREVPIQLPNNGSLGAGAINASKIVTVQSRPYVVGDAEPFRWFNAGEFGDGYLVNSDVMQIFQTVVYSYNRPFVESDLFDAIDSSDGTSATVSFGNDVSINDVKLGDQALNVDDIWVTFRRSLHPSLKWYARQWTNGVRAAFEVPNVAKSAVVLSGAGKTYSPKNVGGERPAIATTAGDGLVAAGQSVEVPVRVNIAGAYPMRILALNLSVEPLDGSPAITAPITVAVVPNFGAPTMQWNNSINNFAGAWLNETSAGLTGDRVLALVTVTIPGNAGSRSAYRIHFEHFSASPNGIAVFDKNIRDGLLTLSDRSESTWSDGIADAWRLRYFGSISAPESAPGADADGDGVINSIEYQNGTDPTTSTSN